ncbi:hypothetical protein THRCLA_09536 [Thraustotheca clavata]|uniref:Secreted protein n=1 Tax=Thraustotheca clavata TaxID=74557 RepID=A0A1V9YVN8_9STRA|nr:hypothetical protein THRCLA_09536 [Thraustotheca clavata]
MKLSLVVISATVAFGQNTCTKLTDPSSPMNSVVDGLYDAVGKDGSLRLALKTVLDDLPSSVSTCLGSITPADALKTLTTSIASDASCAASLSWYLNISSSWSKPDMNNHTSRHNKTEPVPTISNSTFKLPEYLDWKDEEAQKLCTPLTKNLLPCYNKALVPAVAQIVAGTSCCSAMTTDINTLFGQNLSSMLTDLVNKASDVACSIQTPGFSSANQTCIYSFMKSFTNNVNSWPTLLISALNVLQIPNDQGCAAIEGNPFTTTSGTSVSTLYTKPIVPGACAKPLDAFLTYISKYPVLQNLTISDINVNNLFAEGKCVNGSSVKKLVKSLDPKDNMDDALNLVLTDNVCFHLANGYSSTCKTVSSLASTASGDGSTTKTTSSASSLSTMISMASMIALALIY